MYVTLNDSELDMETKLNPNSQRSPCFRPLCAVIKGVCQHARPSYQFFRNFFCHGRDGPAVPEDIVLFLARVCVSSELDFVCLNRLPTWCDFAISHHLEVSHGGCRYLVFSCAAFSKHLRDQSGEHPP